VTSWSVMHGPSRMCAFQHLVAMPDKGVLSRRLPKPKVFSRCRTLSRRESKIRIQSDYKQERAPEVVLQVPTTCHRIPASDGRG
jgi:hypothetical protein